MLPKEIAFVDVETTGSSPTGDRIIEIGILRVSNNKIVQTYNTLVNPQTYISPFIEELTGIKAHELENAPTFEDIKENIRDILSNCVFAAHNVRFDYSFVKNEFRRFEMPFSPKQICTVKLSRHLYPRFKRHNLDSIIQRFNLTCKNRHRAFDDAKILWDFYQIVQKKFEKEILDEVFAKLLKKPSVPIAIPQETLDNLPQTPGVYLFFANDGALLYIGKSKNIKNRVLSHFSSDHLSSTEMKISQQITHIETVKTCGELGALFEESKLIKEKLPLYNKMLRRARKLFALRKKETKYGYHTVSLDLLEKIDVFDIDSIFGIFRSKRQATEHLRILAKEHSLCERILGIESTLSACFAYRLGKCKGACQNKENTLQYNMRFLIAFSKNKLKPWPFDGPIVVEEKDFEEEKKDLFVIDKWCLIKYIQINELDKKVTEYDYNFDLDTYKILSQYLYKRENFKNIKTIPHQNGIRASI